jgi:hypothetical protein
MYGKENSRKRPRKNLKENIFTPTVNDSTYMKDMQRVLKLT